MRSFPRRSACIFPPFPPILFSRCSENACAEKLAPSVTSTRLRLPDDRGRSRRGRAERQRVLLARYGDPELFPMQEACESLRGAIPGNAEENARTQVIRRSSRARFALSFSRRRLITAKSILLSRPRFTPLSRRIVVILTQSYRSSCERCTGYFIVHKFPTITRARQVASRDSPRNEERRREKGT